MVKVAPAAAPIANNAVLAVALATAANHGLDLLSGCRSLALKRWQDNGPKWPARTHFVGPGWLQLGACNTRWSLGVSNAFTVVQKIALTAIVDQTDNSNKRPLLGGGPMAKPPCGQLGR